MKHGVSALCRMMGSKVCGCDAEWQDHKARIAWTQIEGFSATWLCGAAGWDMPVSPFRSIKIVRRANVGLCCR